MMSLSDFKELGGAPSGKWGSNYTKICNLLKTVDALDEPPSYLDKAQRDARLPLYKALTQFHPNDPGGVDKKGQEIQAARRLKAEMDQENQVDRAKVCDLVDRMAKDPMALIRNTGVGLAHLFSAKNRGLSISFRDGGRENASYSGRSIAINRSNFWVSEKLAKAVLVHEYHHVLTDRSGDTYTDEFVAHWKQYLAMGVTMSATDLNYWLLDDPTGYKLRASFAGVSFDNPTQAGRIWTDHIDNLR